MNLFAQLALLSFICFAKTQADICFDCVVLLDYVENLLINEEDNIEEKFDAKCRAQFPEAWSESVCEQLVKTELDNIVKGVEDGLIPDQICDKIGLCHLLKLLRADQMLPADLAKAKAGSASENKLDGVGGRAISLN